MHSRQLTTKDTLQNTNHNQERKQQLDRRMEIIMFGFERVELN